jgi:type II secretory pathway pseudopilin PulG
MLTKNDRLAFSASIIETAQEIAGLASASAQIQQIANKAQALDTANKHLFDPANLLVNQYQAEFTNCYFRK